MAVSLSVRTVVVGSLFGVVFAGAGMYVGQKTAIVDGGNIPAAILAFGVLSTVLRRRPSVDEGNAVQTISSSAAMMALSGGLIGPVAALSLAGHMPSMPLVILWGIAVGAVGCLLAVPLHGAFIVRGTLPFPSGAATAEVLERMYRGAAETGSRVRMLVIGAGLAFGFAFLRSFLGWVPETTDLPFVIAGIPPAAIGLGISWSPLLAAAGFLSGLRVAVSLLVGSALAWIVLGGLLVAHGIAKPDYLSLLDWLLWPATGLMLGGAVGGVIGVWRGVRAGLREVQAADAFRTTRTHALGLAVGSGAVIVLGAVTFDVNPVIPAFALVLSAVLCAAAARADGETDNTPAGPLGGFAQVVIGTAAPGGIDAPLAGGAVVNGALMHSAMMLQNWKTGARVGTPPRQQLVAQLIGVVVGAIACAGAFELIRAAYGLGTEAMPAPAALSWKATAEVVQHGISAMPPYAPLAAAVAFATAIVLGLPRIARYAPSPVAMGMAFILPPYLSITIAIGGIVHGVVTRRWPARANTEGVALASGLIAGEAVAGLVIAGLIIAGVTP